MAVIDFQDHGTHGGRVEPSTLGTVLVDEEPAAFLVTGHSLSFRQVIHADRAAER